MVKSKTKREKPEETTEQFVARINAEAVSYTHLTLPTNREV